MNPNIMNNHLPFNKYSSIENTYRTPYMEKVREYVPKDIFWQVTEKVHGANCCLITDGNIIEFAKRSGVVGEGGGFFNYELVLEKIKDRILKAFEELKVCLNKEVSVIQFYGELFGGAYPHKEVTRDSRYCSVQKGIYYAPYQDFYGFDIAVIYKDGTREWLDTGTIANVFKDNYLFYARTLFVGSLDECLAYSNKFQTKIPEWLGLPPIDDNICEGVVIKPCTPQFFPNGDRILLKNKNERFSEKKGEKVHKEIPVYPDEVQEMLDKLLTYITDNRLCNVISHEGEFDMPRDFGKLIKLFTNDILNDFIKENGVAWYNLTKEYQKALTKLMSGEATKVIKSHYGIR